MNKKTLLVIISLIVIISSIVSVSIIMIDKMIQRAKIKGEIDDSKYNDLLDDLQDSLDDLRDGLDELDNTPDVVTEEGFELKLIDDGSAYSVSFSDKSARNLVIPDVYNNIPITNISS